MNLRKFMHEWRNLMWFVQFKNDIENGIIEIDDDDFDEYEAMLILHEEQYKKLLTKNVREGILYRPGLSEVFYQEVC